MRTSALLTAWLLLTSCAHTQHPTPPERALHVLDAPADYARFGLTETVVPSEDGRHTTPGTDEYEWWYLDGVGDDGTVIVVWFGDNWLVGTHVRHIAIDVTPPGKPTVRSSYTSHEPEHFALDRADVRIGHSTFSGDLTTYRVVVDARDTTTLSCDLTLVRRVAPFRPGTGRIASGDDYFAWLSAVPEGSLEGTLRIGEQTVAFHGSGYHDHNWGNVAPWALMKNWWWGRGQSGDTTVVISELRPADGRGEQTIPLLYVTTPREVLVAAGGKGATFAEDARAPHGDPAYSGELASGVKMTSTSGAPATIHFTRNPTPTTSADLLMVQPSFVRFFARLAGRSPWYTRWASDVSIEVNGTTQQGHGTLEFMDFE